jgi:hypothetical protein
MRLDIQPWEKCLKMFDSLTMMNKQYDFYRTNKIET